MTAREQAREAWQVGKYSDPRNPDPRGVVVAHMNHAADAASDVWEPIVEGLIRDIEGLQRDLTNILDRYR